VCGSLAGMAPGVDAALREVLGDATVNDLASSGRYRRDVY
jgi:sulfite reductase (NADPH) flavoprotein alpha-component